MLSLTPGPGVEGWLVRGTAVVTSALSKLAAVMGTRAYRTRYVATGCPRSAGAIHERLMVVWRRSVTVAVRPVGASGGPRSTTMVNVPVPTPWPGMLSVLAMIVVVPSNSVTFDRVAVPFGP